MSEVSIREAEIWMKRLSEDGVKLIVEIEVDIDQFRTLIEAGYGDRVDDRLLVEVFKHIDRRILPANKSGYCGIGPDVNAIFLRGLNHGR